MSLWYGLQFLHSQFFVRFPYPTYDFSGQTIIVTGSNVGLGLEAARHVTRLGAERVILAVRTLSKGEAAADDIAKSCNVPRSRVEVWQLDMGSSDSIKAFAERARGLKLDAAILNAGVLSMEWSEQAGIESHLAVNVLGTMLLANLLVPVLARTPKSRLAIIGSDIMYIADRKQIDVPCIMDKLKDKTYASQIGDRYPISKLLLMYSVHDLAQRVSDVIITVSTPGACQSDIFRGEKSWAMSLAIATIARTTEVGSRTLVFCVDPDLPAEFHGKFLMDNKVNHSRQILDDKVDARLAKKWNAELKQHLEDVAPGDLRA